MSINIFDKLIWDILSKFPVISYKSLDNLHSLGYFIIMK